MAAHIWVVMDLLKFYIGMFPKKKLRMENPQDRVGLRFEAPIVGDIHDFRNLKCQNILVPACPKARLGGSEASTRRVWGVWACQHLATVEVARPVTSTLIR